VTLFGQGATAGLAAVRAAYCRVDGLKSPVGWLPVHRDQLRAQRSVTSVGKLHLYLYDGTVLHDDKKHFKNVGPIHHCEPPHAALPFTRCHYRRVARRQRIDVHDDDNDNAWQRGPLWPHRMGPIRQVYAATEWWSVRSGTKTTDGEQKQVYLDRTGRPAGRPAECKLFLLTATGTSAGR